MTAKICIVDASWHTKFPWFRADHVRVGSFCYPRRFACPLGVSESRHMAHDTFSSNQKSSLSFFSGQIMATSGHACISFILKVSFKFQLVFSCLQIVFIDPIYTGWREVISFFLYCQTEHSFSSANSSHHQQYDIQVKYHSTVNIELFKTRAVRSHKWTLRLSAQPAQIYSFFLFYLFFFHFSFKLFITLMGKWKVQFFACFNCQLTRQEITLGHLTLSKQILKLYSGHFHVTIGFDVQAFHPIILTSSTEVTVYC